MLRIFPRCMESFSPATPKILRTIRQCEMKDCRELEPGTLRSAHLESQLSVLYSFCLESQPAERSFAFLVSITLQTQRVSNVPNYPNIQVPPQRKNLNFQLCERTCIVNQKGRTRVSRFCPFKAQLKRLIQASRLAERKKDNFEKNFSPPRRGRRRVSFPPRFWLIIAAG